MASDELQILVLCGVAASSAIVGSFLILRKMTMMANSLSHTVLLGIVIAFVLFPQDVHVENDVHHGFLDITTLLIASLACGFLTAF